jgi:methyltransferase (TIGR00027 family)
MREGRSSLTARAVSAARGIAGVDPIAASLVGRPLDVLLRLSANAPVRDIVNVGSLGLVDHAELRTLAVDAAVREATAAGIRQLVILGAGLDARAWRMPELGETRVLEVDHPSTQAYKRRRVAAHRPLARDVRYLPIDFERDGLGDVLARGGHDAAEPTLWVWEGVTPYLRREAIRATLAIISGRSALGSRAAMTYATPRASTISPHLIHVARVVFRAVGEPLLGLIAPEVMHADLARAGWRVLDDSSPPEWAARQSPASAGSGERPQRLLHVDEHLVIAVRDT